MLQAEAMQFIGEQMEPRWPDWKPNSEQIADWAKWLMPYTWETAKNAVREHTGTQTFNKRPNAAKLRPLLAKFHPTHETVKTQIKATVFIWYDGGGRGTLQPGYFFGLFTKHPDIMKIAEQVRKQNEEEWGGEWIVYQDTDEKAMVTMRNTRRAIELNNSWRKVKDVDSQTPPNDKKTILDAVRAK